MRALWITLADPDPPTNGQYLYSNGLIHAFAAAGAKLEVIGLERGAMTRAAAGDTENIRWRLSPNEIKAPLAALCSYLPNLTYRARTRQMEKTLSICLAQDQTWDAIIFDSICAGWALDSVLSRLRRPRHPQLVYIAHNNETAAAAAIARIGTDPVKRLLGAIDESKVAIMETRLLRHCDLVTSNTPEDSAGFRARNCDKPVQCLPPGYDGRILQQRIINADTPRAVIVIGSFDWQPKRASLEAFLSVAAAPLFQASITLHIVGSAQEDYLARLHSAYPSVQFAGAVPDLTPYMDKARAALVPDMLGGFKLKSLDYIFNRLPIFGIEGSVPGVPLENGKSFLLYPDHAALTAGIIQAVDDYDLLNRLQDTAYDACRDRFCWNTIGLSLLGAIHGIAHSTVPPMAPRWPVVRV